MSRIFLRIFIFFGLFFATSSFGAIFSLEGNPSIQEGDSGTKTLNFTVKVYASYWSPCYKKTTYGIRYSTWNGSAVAPSDYQAITNNVLTYKANKTIRPWWGTQECASLTIPIIINGDTDTENDETFTLWLSNYYSNTSINNNSATGTITNDDGGSPTPSGAFPIRKSMNLTGNMKVIGNTVLCPKNGLGQCVESSFNVSNADVNLRYVDIDSDNMTWNSTSATLTDSAINPTTDNPNPAKIKWAGLYWSGYIYKSDFNTAAGASNVINNQPVKLSINGGAYTDITPDAVLGTAVNGSYSGTSYGCFADVTNLMNGNDPRAVYRVANVPSSEGTTDDGLGNSGAWALAIIYENNSTGEKTRNATVFDGFIKIEKDKPQTINVSGFKTPSSGNVDSTLSIFANEGDKYLYGDQFFFENIDGDNAGADITLKNPDNDDDNFFDSSITGVDTRNPNITNNNGIDIHTDQIGKGDDGTGYGIISNNQTKANITLTSDQDTYFPTMVGFATELYKPSLCYDFTGLIGDQIPVPISTDRTFNVSKWDEDDPFYIKVFIRSEEADFDLVNTGLKVILKDINGSTDNISSKLAFDFYKTLVSPDSINGYEAAKGIPSDPNELFSIGENNSHTGGTIGAEENTYAKAAFEFLTSNAIEGKFDIEIHTSLQLDPDKPNELVDYVYSSTDPKNLPMCSRNYIYDPLWLYFNVEPSGSATSTQQVDKYSLLTQIVNRSFDIDVVSYTGAPEYTNEQGVASTTTVDIELINASGFENNASTGYDSVCDDSSNAITAGRFAKIESGKSRVTLDQFTSDVALESAAFRVWVLTKRNEDGESVVVNHTCENANDETCFQTVYQDHYYDANSTENYCDNECGSTPSGCYECLKTYYAVPICSRDNFAIRPESFRIRIYDNNESNETTPTPDEITSNVNTSSMVSLAAGYQYLLELKALGYSTNINDETIALGYYNESFTQNVLSTAPSSDAITLAFDDNTTACNDTSTTTYAYTLSNGKIFNHNQTTDKFSFNNVGDYLFWMNDSNWTRVDQKDYEYKTTFNGLANDDCIVDDANSPGTGKVGCAIDSFTNAKYIQIPLHFNPYGFDLSGVNMTNSPDNNNTSWLFTNNLSEDPRMGARFYGGVIAIAKGGVATNNFVTQCAATDVNLDLNITSTPEEGNITATDINGSTASIGLNNIIIGADSNTTNANGTQATIANKYFAKDSNGSSTIDLRYNYDRLNDMVTNPIFATFNSLTASAPDANASAHMDDNRTPDGEQNYDRNITFLKGRVYTELEEDNPGGHDVEDDNIDIIFTVEAYCDNMFTCADMIHDLNSDNSIVGNNGWYPMTSHDHITDSNGFNDGKIVELKDEDSEGVIISPALDIQFDDGAKTSDVNIEEGTASDPAKIQIYPDPWLKYHEDSSEAGNPYFILNFESLSDEWTGIGNTGHKIDINASKGSMDRTTW